MSSTVRLTLVIVVAILIVILILGYKRNSSRTSPKIVTFDTPADPTTPVVDPECVVNEDCQEGFECVNDACVEIIDPCLSCDLAQLPSWQPSGKIGFGRPVKQSTGKFVFAFGRYPSEIPGLVRYNNDGTIDTTFGVNGFAMYTPVTPYYSSCLNLSVGDDDSLYAGWIDGQNADSYCTKFSANGVRNMAITLPYWGLYEGPDGKLYSIGEDGIRRWSSTLVLDTSYGTNGHTTLNGAYPSWFPQAIHFHSDGSLMVANEVYFNGRQPAVVKILPSGQPDNSFGTAGIAFMPLDTAFGPEFTCEYLQQGLVEYYPDESFLVNAASPSSEFFDCWEDLSHIYIKYLPNGTIDTSYGTNGFLKVPRGVTQYEWPNQAANITLACDNSVLVFLQLEEEQTYPTPSIYTTLIYKITAGGVLDTNFTPITLDFSPNGVIQVGDQLVMYGENITTNLQDFMSFSCPLN